MAESANVLNGLLAEEKRITEQLAGMDPDSDEYAQLQHELERVSTEIELRQQEARDLGVFSGDMVPNEDDFSSDHEDVETEEEEDVEEVYEGLPAGFGTETLRQLDMQVREKDQRLQVVTRELEEHKQRVSVMSEHLRNVKQELVHTQELCDAKRKEIETEDHLRMLSQREAERVRNDTRRLDIRRAEQQDQLNSAQNAIFSANEKLESFKTQMHWNQEELLQWSLAVKQKDEDQQALEQYQKQDSIAIKQLATKLEKATRLASEAKAALDAEMTETMATQIELDRTAEEYKKLHEERQNLIKQWADAQQAIQRRDQAIAMLGEKIQERRAAKEGMKERLREQDRILEAEQAKIAEVEHELSLAERDAAQKRLQLHSAGEGLTELEDEMFAVRNELTQAHAELNENKRTITALQEQIDEREQQVIDAERLLKERQAEMENEYTKTKDLNVQAQQVDKLHAQTEKQLKAVDKMVEKYKDEMFKKSNELFQLRKTEANLIGDISSAQGSSRNLQARIHDLDQRSLKQQEMLYNIEFEVQQLERKVAYAGGKRSVEETLALKARIEDLKLQLESETKKHNLLVQQTKRLQNDVRSAKRQHETVMQELNQVREQLNQLELENAVSAEAIKKESRKKEEVAVQHDTLKLDVKHLRDQLVALAEEVDELENRKLNLEFSMDERQKEVSSHKEMQRAEMKIAEDARRALTMDLKERQLKLDKLKHKFETISGKMQTQMGAMMAENGVDLAEVGEQGQSQAYYIIAAAQHREELQRSGDDLNTKIQKAEKEIRLLQKTLDHLVGRNQAYRESFHKPENDSAEMKLKAKLEEQHRAETERLFSKRTYLRDLSLDYSERKTVLTQYDTNLGRINNEISQLEQRINKQKQAAQLDAEKLQRARSTESQARQMFLKIMRDRDEKTDDGDLTKEELHIELQEQRFRNATLLQTLEALSKQYSDLNASIISNLELADLMPSSRPSTAASEVSHISTTSSRASQSRLGVRSRGKALPVSTAKFPSTEHKQRTPVTPTKHGFKPKTPLSGRSSRTSSRGSARASEDGIAGLSLTGHRAGSGRSTPKRSSLIGHR